MGLGGVLTSFLVIKLFSYRRSPKIPISADLNLPKRYIYISGKFKCDHLLNWGWLVWLPQASKPRQTMVCCVPLEELSPLRMVLAPTLLSFVSFQHFSEIISVFTLFFRNLKGRPKTRDRGQISSLYCISGRISTGRFQWCNLCGSTTSLCRVPVHGHTGEGGPSPLKIDTIYEKFILTPEMNSPDCVLSNGIWVYRVCMPLFPSK